MKTVVIAVSGYLGAGKNTVECFNGIIRKKGSSGNQICIRGGHQHEHS